MEASALHAPPGITRLRGSAGTTFLRLRSDEQLVELFRAGHEEAFRAIHDRYRARLFAYTRQMLPQSRQDAEDALQDVFIRAYAGLRANDRHVALRAWLYRIAHNRCVDHLRKNAPIPTDELEATSRDVATDPIAATEQRETLAKLVCDVQRLPEQQRSALLLRELSGMSYQELADSLDLTIPAIKSLLVRARGGLAAAAEARDTACAEIRVEIIESHERGVRPNALVRRHLSDCGACREYRESVRGISRSLAALIPGPILLAGKFLGAGAVSSAGTAAGTSATAASGGTTAGGALVGTAAGSAGATGAAAAAGGAITGGAVAGGMTATHLAALIAAAAATAGGAVAVSVQGGHSHPASATHLPAAAIVAHAVTQGISSGNSAAAVAVAPLSVPAGTLPSAPAPARRRSTGSGPARHRAAATTTTRTAAQTTTVRTATATRTSPAATTTLPAAGTGTTGSGTGSTSGTSTTGTATTASAGTGAWTTTGTTTAPSTAKSTTSAGTSTTSSGSTTTAQTDTATATTPDQTSTTAASSTPQSGSSASGASTTSQTTTSPSAGAGASGGSSDGSAGSTQ